MVQGGSEIAAMCLGLVGLIGAAATTGMPMWKVTAFIEENIIVMETRWEGLWMNCYRQANIRMQCKVYDSLLYLPPDLQAARGLMCCSLALSGLGLLAAMAGMRCTSCVQDNDRVKALILMIAGGMQLMASICVFIPVSWTGHVIIKDFYNPLLIDAQRRELGEALYIGWVTGAFLFASAAVFLCRRVPSNKASFDMYHPANTLGYMYKPPPHNPTLMRYHPISSVPSFRASPHHISSVPSLRASPHPPALHNSGSVRHHLAPSMQNMAVYNPGLAPNGQLFYHQGHHQGHHSSNQSSNFIGSRSTPGNSLYSKQAIPYSSTYTGNSSFHAAPQSPVFIGYTASRIEPDSYSGSSGGVYI